MKTMLLSLLFSLVLILALFSSTKAGNVVNPTFRKNVSSYGVIKPDTRDDRKETIKQLKGEEEDEGDDEDDDEGDDNDDEEEG